MQLTRLPLPPNIRSADVAERQRALRQLNFSVADPDGFLAARPHKHSRRFQRDQQIEQTGVVDRNFSEEAAGQVTLEHAATFFLRHRPPRFRKLEKKRLLIRAYLRIVATQTLCEGGR